MEVGRYSIIRKKVRLTFLFVLQLMRKVTALWVEGSVLIYFFLAYFYCTSQSTVVGRLYLNKNGRRRKKKEQKE